MLKRVLMWGGVIIAVAVSGFFVWRANKEELFVPREIDEVVAETNDPKEIARYMERLEEAYRNDAYGGATAEETLNLFISALKAGDTDLAAKYFLLEEQEKMKGELRISKQNNVLPLLIGDLEKERIGKDLYKGSFRFRTKATAEEPSFSFDLIQNPYTKKWKIESL